MKEPVNIKVSTESSIAYNQMIPLRCGFGLFAVGSAEYLVTGCHGYSSY